MNYHIFYDASIHVVNVIYRGKLTLIDIGKMAVEVAKMTSEYQCFRILGDAREVKLSLRTMELYDFPKVVRDGLALAGLRVGKMKSALLIKSDMDDYRFMETVAINSGYTVRIFLDIDEAKKWLLEE